MKAEKLNLNFIVNGQSVSVEAESECDFQDAAVLALDKSGNSGQPVGNWELRDSAGSIIDMAETVVQSNPRCGETIYLNLKAGVGGNCVV